MKKRLLALAVACMMLASTLAGCGSGNADSSAGPESSSAQDTASDAVTTAAEQLLGHSDTDGKEETVYVIADPNGKPDQVIVSEWLKNGDGADTIRDASRLNDIENVKGDEDYTKGSGDTLTWNAQGKDIYYQGTSTAQLPVDVTVTYKLDGKPVTAEKLDGASGKLTIQFDYKNNTAKKQKINGEQVTIYQPFLMVSGLVLDGEKATNVEVTNGKVVNSGDKQIAVGLAMPGLSESLGLNDLKDEDGKAIDLDLPEQVTITADVTDFSLLTTVTVATNSALEELNLDDVDSVDDLKDSLEELGEASEKLVDGSQDLADGVGELDEKSGDLADGVNTLDDSTKEIAKGSDTLKNGADQVNSGANQVKEGANSAASAAGKISDGSSQIASNMDTLANSVAGLPDAAAQLLNGAKGIKTALGDKKSTGNTIYTGAMSIEQGAKQLSSSLKNSDGTSIYEAAVGIQSGAEQIKSGAQAISSSLTQAASNLKNASDDADCSEDYIKLAISQLQQLSNAEGATDEMKSTYATIIKELQGSLQYQDGVYSALTSSGDNTLQGGLSSIENGASTISTYAGKIADGSVSLADGADQIAAGAQAIESGIDTMVSGNNGSNLNALIDGLNQLNSQSGTLVEGVNKLDEASNTLSDSMGQLADGTNELSDGAGSLADGTAELANGAGSLSGYLGQLSDGTGELSEGVSALIDGIGQLLDGSNDLAEGMAEFDKEGIQKLTGLMDSDLTGIVDRLKAIQDYADSYQSYGGNVKDMDCSTKFIYKTDSIGE